MFKHIAATSKRLIAKSVRLIRERKFKYLFLLCFKGCKMLVSRVIYARYYLHDKDQLFAQMKQDPRFHITDGMLHFLFDFPPIKRYEMDTIKLGEIRRFLEGNIIPINETPEYRFAAYNDEEGYATYVSHANDGSKNLDAIIAKDISHFRQTIVSMDKGYDIHKLVIVVNSQNLILDGSHRCGIMYYKFGPDYEIPILRVWQCFNAF